MPVEVWTVADDAVVVHADPTVPDGTGTIVEHTGLPPAAEVEIDGFGTVRTLERPRGERLATVCTVNDVHFGEDRCGVLEESPEVGPVLTTPEGDEPYPEVMNRAAIAEIRAVAPDAVAAKGDLTAAGTQSEYDAFLDAYGGAFEGRLVHVRGNHDAMAGLTYANGPRSVDVPGVTLALLDTVIPGTDRGALDRDQLDWLDTLAAEKEKDGRMVLAMGHHHPWSPHNSVRPDSYFGIHPDWSERLFEVIARRPAIVAYTCGHTHRNRVRRFPEITGQVPYVEVGCTKDFPGSWAEYRIFEGGIVQIHHRTSTPAALAWSEQCRGLYMGTYEKYASGTIADRCFVINRRT